MPIRVSYNASPAAPKRPGKAALQKIFAHAWTQLPAAKRKVCAKSRYSDLCVDVHGVDDAEIAEFNQRHMNHSGPTDVLSFPLLEDDPERRAFMLGEIILSFETAQREATARGLPYEEEVLRYAVHGFLHLLGYDDATPKQAKAMHALQEKIISTRNAEVGTRNGKQK